MNDRKDQDGTMQRVTTRRFMLAACAAATLPCATRKNAHATDRLPNAIRFIQGFQLGTLQDRYGRVFAQALSTLQPTMRVTIESMPRANGRLAARHLMEAAPDGATIGTFQNALVFAELLGDEGVAFELERFGWIGGFTVEPRVLVVSSKSGIASFEMLRTRSSTLAVGAETITSVSAREPLILNALLGTRLRPVPGYSTAVRNLALATGEIAAATASLDAVLPLIESGEVRALLRLDRHPVPPPLEAVPTLQDIVTADRYATLLAFIQAQSQLGRWVCMPPNTTPERLDAWRTLFSKAIASDVFRSAARDAGLAGPHGGLVAGDQIRSALAEIFGSRVAMASALRAAIDCGGQIADTGKRSC